MASVEIKDDFRPFSRLETNRELPSALQDAPRGGCRGEWLLLFRDGLLA